MKSKIFTLGLLLSFSFATPTFAEQNPQTLHVIESNKQLLDKFFEDHFGPNNMIIIFNAEIKLKFSVLFDKMLSKIRTNPFDSNYNEIETIKNQISALYFNLEKAEASFRNQFTAEELAAYNAVYEKALSTRDYLQNKFLPAYRNFYLVTVEPLQSNPELTADNFEELVANELHNAFEKETPAYKALEEEIESFKKRHDSFFNFLAETGDKLEGI